jgi:ATP adenylyltransferase
MEYINGIDKEESGCIFCNKPKQNNDRENLIVYRSENVFIILNLYPYNNGHLLVVPYTHVDHIEKLDEASGVEIWRLCSLCTSVLSRAFCPDGFNIGMNIGRTAGAGIDQHIHLHIVPRWNGDTNFMPAVGKTKIISQDILETYDALAPYFKKQ